MNKSLIGQSVAVLGKSFTTSGHIINIWEDGFELRSYLGNSFRFELKEPLQLGKLLQLKPRIEITYNE